nr:endosialidase [uncultured Mediterranean phage uvMED]
MAQTQVSGSGIKDNVITNSHLHSAANIAGSKLANSGVTAGSYGSGSATLSLTINAQGLITAASANSISTDLVNDTSPQLGGDLDTNGNDIRLADNDILYIGTGNDGTLYHDGSNTYLSENGTGELYLQGNTFVAVRSSDTGEKMAKFIRNGAVELYHDASKKFETTSTGANLYGHFLPNTTDTYDLGSNSKKWSEAYLKHYLYMPDDGRIRLGSNYDMQLWHNGSHQILLGKTGNTYVTCPSSQSVRLGKSSADNFSAEQMVTAYADGAVELYYDNSKKFETTSTGATVTGNLNCTALLPTGNLELVDSNAGNVGRIRMGAGDDFKLYHNGFHSYIENQTGSLYVPTSGNFYVMNAAASSTYMYASGNEVALYHTGNKKFETTSTGITQSNSYLNHLTSTGNTFEIRFTTNGTRRGSVYADNGNTVGFLNPSGGWSARWHSNGKQTSHGDIVPNANNAQDLGSTSLRWRNIYTNDLNLSNEGGANDVDGTWGSFTIQEGAEDLFLVNKRNGKKYKFALTEVS